MSSCLIPLFGIPLAAWLFFSKTLNVSGNKENTNDRKIMTTREICDTKECLQIAEAFIESMNKSTNPCDDFYEFVCGNWESKNPTPDYELKWSSSGRFQLLAETRLREELESEPSSEDIPPIQYVKQLYKSCMDIETRESEGLQKISAILQQAKGWPMTMNTWNSEAATWQEIDHYYERLIGVYAFFTVDTPDVPSGTIKLEFDRPVFPLKHKTNRHSRNYTSDGIKVYRSVIKDIAKLFIQQNKENVPDEKLDEDIDDLLKLEEKLYKAEALHAASIDAHEMIALTDEWNGNTTQGKIDWKRILQNLYSIAKFPIINETLIYLPAYEYFSKLVGILNSTNERTIVNYIHWNFLSKTLPHTTEQVKDILFKIVENESGLQRRAPGWLTCVREIEKHAAAYLFARKYYTNESNAAVEDLIRNLKKSFEFQINNSNWLSIEAKEAAVKKLHSLLVLSGYPKWYNNETALIKYYENLTIETSYFDNVLKSMKHEWLQSINRWGKFMGKQIWTMNVLTPGGRYHRIFNVLNIPAATLQSPLFDRNLPDYIRYGTAGMIISHEIGHAFDAGGRHFGAVPGEKLFAGDVGEMYRRHVQCFVEIYDGYFERDTEHSILGKNRRRPSRGKLMLDENLADWSGVLAAFHAYKEMLDKEPNGEFKLPGLEEFTDEQMFFISHAHKACAAETAKNYGILDSHAIKRIRVIGTLSNTLAFAEAYKCPKNSPMNPEKKCNIWMNPSVALQN